MNTSLLTIVQRVVICQVMETDQLDEDRMPVAEIVLRILLGGAVITTIFVIPNLAILLKPLVDEINDRFDKRALERSLYRLRERGMIHYNPQHTRWELTEKGFRQARTYELRDLNLPRPPSQWDGRWRLIIFDVPERARYLRNLFRRKLTVLGFTYVQKSAWVYPYPCQDVLTELSSRLGLEGDIVFVETDHLFPEKRLLRRYSLKRPT